MADQIWAPWRMAYIAGPAIEGSTGDIFVDLPAAEDDAKNLIVHRGKTAFVLLNAYPYTSGHLMIAPFRAVPEPDGLTDAELLEINQLVVRATRWLKQSHHAQGFNIGVNVGRSAGAGIPIHVHWHVVPRWDGDTNFMSVVAGTRVIPQSLEETFVAIRKVIDAGA